MAHPIFGRSVNPISTRGDKLCPPNYYWHTRIFRPSDGPASGSRRAVVTCQVVIKQASGSCQGHQAVIKDLRSFLKNVVKSFFRRPADQVWLSYFSPRLLTNFHCPICGLYYSSQCYWHWDWTRNLAPCKVGLERTEHMIVGYRFLFLYRYILVLWDSGIHQFLSNWWCPPSMVETCKKFGKSTLNIENYFLKKNIFFLPFCFNLNQKVNLSYCWLVACYCLKIQQYLELGTLEQCNIWR